MRRNDTPITSKHKEIKGLLVSDVLICDGLLRGDLYFVIRGSGVRVSPGAPQSSIKMQILANRVSFRGAVPLDIWHHFSSFAICRGNIPHPTGSKAPALHFKKFRPVPWYDGLASIKPGSYISHLSMELGRLGLEIPRIERHAPGPRTATVLSDLTDWLSHHPGEAYARLIDW